MASSSAAGVPPPPPASVVAVVGGGAWGTALAAHAARAGHEVRLYAREKEVVDAVNDPAVRENTTFLPGFKLPETGLRATTVAADALRGAELVLLVVPTPFLETVVSKALLPHLDASKHILVSCTKGILNDTLETPADILERTLGKGSSAASAPSSAGVENGSDADTDRSNGITSLASRACFISGPSFAAEVARGAPTVVTVASRDRAAAERVQLLLSTPVFRCYTSTDVVGVEMGGALKNVLAIGCGVSDGLGFGANARAALVTRGLGEMTRLAVARGAHPLTMGGLAGLGDLVLTCTGDLSRNRTVGLRIGGGETLEQIAKSMTAVAEGVLTARSAAALARKLGVDAPIIDGIDRVLHEGADARDVVTEVMTRELKPELHDDVLAAAAKVV